MSDGRFDSWGVVVVLVGSLLFTCSLALSHHLCCICSAFTTDTQHSSVKSVIGKGKGSCYTSPLPLTHFPHFISNSFFSFCFLVLYYTPSSFVSSHFSLLIKTQHKPLCLSTSFFSFSSYSSPTNLSLPLQSLATPKWLL